MEDRLKKFARLIDSGTYTAAARTLHTSQPALTASIQKLERELKTPLLVRSTRALKLTSAGKIAYTHGHQLLLAEHNLQHDLRRLEEQKQPLALGCIDSIASILVEADLLPILERDSELSLNVQASSGVVEQLKRAYLDLAIVVEQGEQPADTDQRFLGNEKFALVCHDEYAKTYTDMLRKGLLTNFLAYNQGSNTNQLVSDQLRRQGVQVEPRFYSTNPAILLGLALQGKGVAALPLSLVGPYLGNTLSDIVLKKPLHRPIVALWRSGHRLPESTEDFLDAAQIQLI